MRILLDVCVPKALRRSLIGHDVSTAGEIGWNRLPDGKLLENIAHTFDVLLSIDKSIPFQQWLDHRPFAVVVLRARTNRLVDLLPLVPPCCRRWPR